MGMEYDVFICHASEDKKEVAIPLAKKLQTMDIKVWLDTQELKLGDSLREKIEDGLANSRFGLVILSDAFFAKRWPQRELNALTAKEHSGEKVILPVWHGIDHAYLTEHAPFLADRLAVDTSIGLDSVVSKIIEVVPLLPDPISWTQYKALEEAWLSVKYYQKVRCPVCDAVIAIGDTTIHSELFEYEGKCPKCGWEDSFRVSQD